MFVLRKFGGEIPQLPADLLPEWAAQQASFCDFSRGRLEPLKQGFLIGTMSGNVGSIYTEDGINFFTWPVQNVCAVKGPILRDTYSRIYFLESGELRVATTAGIGPTGGPPGSSWKAGVPKPTAAPTLALVDRTTLRDYPGATWSVKTWWEYGQKRYQEADVALTTVTALREFTFNAPVIDTGTTPAEAVVRCTLRLLDASSRLVLSVTLTAGDDAYSSALPGGVTVSMTKVSGSQHKLELMWGIVETRAYVYTCRNTWLEEGGPSPAAMISVTHIQDVGVTLPAVSFAGGYRPLSDYRTYRTMGTSSSYLRVAEGAGLTFTDASAKGSDVLGSLDTLDFESPPTGLQGLVRLPGGALAAFSGSTLYLSQPYAPHTWQHQHEFPKAVRGLMAAPGTLVVTTAEFSYALFGDDPSGMSPRQLPVAQAGLTQRSMAQLDREVVFASNDGFVTAAGSQASMARSQALFTRQVWRDRYGASLDDGSLAFAHHDGALVAASSARASGFVLRTDESVAGQFSRYDVDLDALFYLPAADALYYSQGANVYQFAGGDPHTYIWWSREAVYQRPRNLGAGFIRCDGTVTVQVYTDGALWQTRSLQSGPFRLPSTRKTKRWSIKLTGTGAVHEFYLVTTPEVLKRVTSG